MSSILNGYTNDIDFVIDTTNFSITGQVFVHNLAVYFKITVWDEGKNRTRFECRRTKGDTVAFTEFWNHLEEALYQQFGNPIGFGQGQNANDLFDIWFGIDPLYWGVTAFAIVAYGAILKN